MPAESRDLREHLQAAMDRRFAPPRPITRLIRRRSEYESSFRLEELMVEFENGPPLSVMFKDVSRGALSPAALAAKSPLLHDPRRELKTYQVLLSIHGVGPPLLGIVEEESLDRYWLFIERVSGVELYQVGDLAVWQEVAAWLARMHSRFSRCLDGLDASVPLLSYDRCMFERLLHDALCSASGDVRDLAASLAPGFDDLLGGLSEWPRTLVHGDFYASNVIIRSQVEQSRVVPVDWEMAGRGPGLLDLAALTAGDWSGPERDAIARAYHEALSAVWSRAPSAARFKSALDCCRLLLALRWLTVPEDWRPPEAHAHDWLTEAAEITQGLSLACNGGA